MSRIVEVGGATGARTPDLLHAMQMLSQLSYRPRSSANSSSRGVPPPLTLRSAAVVAEPIRDGTSYSIRRSARARRSRLTISDDGSVLVILPQRAPLREADALVVRHQAWIDRHRQRFDARRRELALRPSLAAGRVLHINGRPEIVHALTQRDHQRLQARLRREARVILEARVAERAPVVGVRVGRVTIRDQKTRWGSASRNGTLSFSWRLLLTPPEVLDYVVIHELAHLRQAGHGRAFWNLVARHFPAHATARRWLREHHDEIRHALD